MEFGNRTRLWANLVAGSCAREAPHSFVRFAKGWELPAQTSATHARASHLPRALGDLAILCSPRLRRLPLTILSGALVLSHLSALAPAAAQINTSGSKNCTAVDFDSDIQFLNGPGDVFTLLIHKRNIGDHACVFDGPMYGPSLVPDRVEGGKPVGMCYLCDERGPNGMVGMQPPISVAPGQTARQTFRWKTKSADASTPCVPLKWMAEPVLLVTPSLLKPVCSDVEVSRFILETTSNAAADPDSPSSSAAPAFELSAERSRYNTGENFSLKFAPVRPGPGLAPNPEACPTFYLRQRSPDGATRIDEVTPITSVGCKTFMPGRRPINSASSFEIDSGANSRWMGVGQHQLEVLQLVGSVDDPRIRFVSSNTLQIEVADPAIIARKWAGRAKGVGVDVTLDKDTYKVGENIPLHMAIKDFDAPVPIFTWDPLWDPCMTVGVQVVDSARHPLAQDARFPDRYICTGHGFGPRPVEKGKIIPIERSLAGEGWLPNQPGTYTVRVTWAPCTGSTIPGQPFAQTKAYTEVEAKATFQVIAADVAAKQ